MELINLGSYMQKNKLDYSLIPWAKLNSKWIKDLNLRPGTIKVLEEGIGSMLFGISLSNMVLDISPQEREIHSSKVCFFFFHGKYS